MMVKGLVYKVFSRQAGRGTAYSIKLDGDAEYYGTGFKSPGNIEGKYVTFEAGKNAKGYWEVDLSSLRVMETDAKVAAKEVGDVLTKDTYWNRKEERDVLNDKLRNVGASTNTAIAFVELLLKAEAIQIPTKKPDREKAIAELVSYYAAKFRGENPVDAVLPQKAPEAAEALAEASGWN